MAIFLFDFRHLNKEQLGARYALELVLWAASGSLNVWFWFKGLDNVHPDQCMEPRVFFFANLNATGGVRVFFRILTLGFLIWFVALYGPHFCRGFKVGFMAEWNRQQKSKRRNPDEERADGAMMHLSNRGETVATAQSTSTKSAQESDQALQGADCERQESRHGTTIFVNEPVSPSADDSATKKSVSVVIESVSPSPPHEVATLETNRNSIFAAPDASVAGNAPSAVASSLDMVKDSGAKSSRSDEIESIPPTPAIPPPTIAAPEKTEAPTQVSPDASPSQVLADDVASHPREGSTQASEGPDAYDWNIAIVSGIVLVLYIVPAELQLWWNHLDGIYSVNTTGQIIPLSLGSFSLLRALYLLKEANWSKLRRDPEKVMKRVVELRNKISSLEEWKASE